MATKTAAKRPDLPMSETTSKKSGGAKALPAVSPVQQKPIESRSQTIQKQGAPEEEALQGKFMPIQKMGSDEEEPVQGKFMPIQKVGAEEEEPMQGKFEPIQKVGAEEEEPMQGKFEPIQKVEEEEPMQGKFEPIQKVEEEEPMQGKFEPIQKVEEEEPMQGKFEPIQKVEEEEPVQGKFEPIQKVEEEEPMQGKFEPVQKMEEEEPMQGKFSSPVQKKAANTTQLENGANANSSANANPTANSENKTGLSDNLKSGIENLSGVAIDDVKVHYNSDKPAQLQALAYAQGTDIHVAPGQEKHVPHEAWHVVQQKQGRVEPTVQMKQGIPVNDDVGLEHEADVMGAQALAKGNEMAQPVQKRLIGGKAVVQGLFGEDFEHVKEQNAELRPGLSMVHGGYKAGALGLTGAKNSLSLAGSGIAASGRLAAAPANWAREKMKGTNSRWKKFGFGALGFLGSIFSGAAGAVGAVGSAALGAVGAVGSAGLGAAGAATGAAVGGVATGLGGLVTGGKAAVNAARGVNVQQELGNYGTGATHDRLGDRGDLNSEPESAFNPDGSRVNYGRTTGSELAGYGMMGASALSSGARSLTDYSQMMHNGSVPLINGKSIADAGFSSNMSGAANAFGGLGAASGIIGTASALKDSYSAGREAADSTNRTGERIAAGAQSASSLADATKASATAAWNIASLVDAKGAAAAGAQVAAGGAGIAMGAIDFIRGGYGVWKAGDRKKALQAIIDGERQKPEPDPTVIKMAEEAIASQDREKTKGVGNLVKGAVTIAGGALLVASMATPIGWALMGGAAIIGGIFALYNYIQKGKRKEEVVMRELNISKDDMDAWKEEREKKTAEIKAGTGFFSKARKEQLAQLEPSPLDKALKEHGFKSVGHCYSNYINVTANQIYTKGVVGGDEQYLQLLSGMGLQVDKKDPENPKPTADKIAKALSV